MDVSLLISKHISNDSNPGGKEHISVDLDQIPLNGHHPSGLRFERGL